MARDRKLKRGDSTGRAHINLGAILGAAGVGGGGPDIVEPVGPTLEGPPLAPIAEAPGFWENLVSGGQAGRDASQFNMNMRQLQFGNELDRSRSMELERFRDTNEDERQATVFEQQKELETIQFQNKIDEMLQKAMIDQDTHRKLSELNKTEATHGSMLRRGDEEHLTGQLDIRGDRDLQRDVTLENVQDMLRRRQEQFMTGELNSRGANEYLNKSGLLGPQSRQLYSEEIEPTIAETMRNTSRIGYGESSALQPEVGSRRFNQAAIGKYYAGQEAPGLANLKTAADIGRQQEETKYIQEAPYAASPGTTLFPRSMAGKGVFQIPERQTGVANIGGQEVDVPNPAFRIIDPETGEPLFAVPTNQDQGEITPPESKIIRRPRGGYGISAGW